LKAKIVYLEEELRKAREDGNSSQSQLIKEIEMLKQKVAETER
jgi:hypothetical protein